MQAPGDAVRGLFRTPQVLQLQQFPYSGGRHHASAALTDDPPDPQGRDSPQKPRDRRSTSTLDPRASGERARLLDTKSNMDLHLSL